ncbi:MAG: ATP-binding cassette domain-containing protein [Planctomycetaceae bacterium]|jgi:excinuclease ABC subunit A|nr:ATP-binding cassette domain-containing protein [Planctomycetaceae bacterium]
MSDIIIRGAREHNLRDVELRLPRNQLICFTGVSGSGKSSLAFDTLYAEGQRRYVESLSSFARQFLGQLPKPDVDFISGLSPSISISQKVGGVNTRSTVGTITEIYDFLRLLYARVATGYCPNCGKPITAQTRQQVIDRIETLPQGTRYMILAPVVRNQRGEHRDLIASLLKQGFIRARIDGHLARLTDNVQLDRQMRHQIEVVIDRLVQAGAENRSRLAESVERALKIGDGNIIVITEIDPDKNDNSIEHEIALSAQYACTICNINFVPPTPQMFSFNSPQGMCPHCDGLGHTHTFDPDIIIPDQTRSIQQNCIEPLGAWKDMGRWRQHIFVGVAEHLERQHRLPPNTVLETAWEELPVSVRNAILWGTGNDNIVFQLRTGQSYNKWTGKFEGIIPRMTQQYKEMTSLGQRREMEDFMREITCVYCHGDRLNEQARSFKLETGSTHQRFSDANGGKKRSLPQLCELPITDLQEFFTELVLTDSSHIVAAEAIKEVRNRLGFLANVGLEYLSLGRTAPTLSGGEMQRIRLAGQIGSGLVGVLYVLDEPSIGLHPRDNDRLLATLEHLRNQGNTVVVVEHDEETMRAADLIVDFGPGPGIHGGNIVAFGTPDDIVEAAIDIENEKTAKNAKKNTKRKSSNDDTDKTDDDTQSDSVNKIADTTTSVTARYLAGVEKIEVPQVRRSIDTKRQLWIRGAAHNNLKNIDVAIPLGVLVCITGVSGSGKSSLVNDILVEVLMRDLNNGYGLPGRYREIEGLDLLDKMISIDQSPIGRTPRSNPATYIKLLDEIRHLFANLHESREKGYEAGRFSFNVTGGRCEACEGNGAKKLEMDFLADVWVTCPTCQGRRFNFETLSVRFKGKSIDQVLNMDVEEALVHFENIPKIKHKLQLFSDVGLGYMKLGQPSPTLSGGEAQRIKLARELVKRSTGKTLYLLDEPTTGLHFADIKLLLKVLQNLVDAGNTVLVVEHNLDVIKTADWIIDLGPEGGEAGGQLIAQGTPEQVAAVEKSYTGAALRKLFNSQSPLEQSNNAKLSGNKNKTVKTKKTKPPTREAEFLSIRNAEQHNLKTVSLELQRQKMTVFCGPSGSGKTSLAMDTIYAEGQRRYVESLGSYARQFVDQMPKPKVERIEGLSPAIAIEQKSTSHSPRSTVGTITEIHDFLRVLFARLGTPYCPVCDVPVGTQTIDEIIAKIWQHKTEQPLLIAAPIEIETGQHYTQIWDRLLTQGFTRVRIDGVTFKIDDKNSLPDIDRRRKHNVELVVDRVLLSDGGVRARLADSVETALDFGGGVVHVVEYSPARTETQWKTYRHSRHLACERCGRSFEPLTPHHFSFNSPLGWCPHCEGLGVQSGSSQTLFLHDPKLSLAEGAVSLFPNVKNKMFVSMLNAFSRETGVPKNVPFEQLDARHRRTIFHGCGDTWIDADVDGSRIKYQYKGLYPAIEEAARLVPGYRGMFEYTGEVECSVCLGSRLRDDVSAVRFIGMTMDQVCRQPLDNLLRILTEWKPDQMENKVAGDLIHEVRNRLSFLVDVGLEYLTLSRPAPTLSGGEMQRIRLAAQIGSGLVGVLYVLDEPTIGLHPRDNHRLIGALQKLRDLGNTLLLVEHDRDVINQADAVVDFGPKAGQFGGEILAAGTPNEVMKSKKSVTGPFLSGKEGIPIPMNRRVTMPEVTTNNGTSAKKVMNKKAVKKSSKTVMLTQPSQIQTAWLKVLGARQNNLKSVDVAIPVGALTVVTGVSGSGKSSLIEDVLYNQLAKTLHRAQTTPGAHDKIEGLGFINKVIRVDQQPLGQTPTSNPATYTGLFESIRDLFAQLPEARVRGYTARRFSFNVPGGRCEKCEGNGQLKIEMHFLPDVWITCDVCGGKRYDKQTLEVLYHGHSIADVLEMPCGEALKLFANIPQIRRVLQTLCDVGLDYVSLGQAAPTLSGGEAQRVKLAAELSRPDTGKTLYLLDEPTTGLHFDDLAKLLKVLNRLVDVGNTVVIIEHNLDVIKSADWIIDMGPEAGLEGGYLVYAGTPESLVERYGKAPSVANATAKSVAKKSEAKKATGKKKVTKSAADNIADYANIGVRGDSSYVARRSYTAEALAPVLANGIYAKRELYQPPAIDEPVNVPLAEMIGESSMMWEIDGRRWHSRDRVSRSGNPCKWDGKILLDIVDRIEESSGFADTNWKSRTLVEICGEQPHGGWFFHAYTSEEWLLRMKFRVAKQTFRNELLVERLNLKPLNEMQDIPLYGNEPRVRVTNNTTTWQEIELKVYSYDEINRTEFWEFIQFAIEGFARLSESINGKKSPEDAVPWKLLKEKWHFLPKGFDNGNPKWSFQLLKQIFAVVKSVDPQVKIDWEQKDVVICRTQDQTDKQFWLRVHTKNSDAIQLEVNNKNKITSITIEENKFNEQALKSLLKKK